MVIGLIGSVTSLKGGGFPDGFTSRASGPGDECQKCCSVRLKRLSAQSFTGFFHRSLRFNGKTTDFTTYAVIVLDARLPGLDGISVTRAYRASSGCAPILLLGDTHCSLELQGGLDAGADAYLAKPLRMDDVAAHVRALMRRPALRNEVILYSGGIEMDTDGGTVSRDDVFIHLHPMEYKLLQFLMRHPNQVFSAHALFEIVWQKDFGSMEDTVRTHVRTLRQKIDAYGSASVITTVRGLGYKTIQL